MRAETLIDVIGSDFYAGVPDSLLRALCDCLMNKYGTDGRHHVIAANEGNAVGLAAGYHLATGKIPVVYMQNSGEGNAVNPVASLLNEKVYAIPMVFIVGWRGEPGVHDEPQHIFQGEVTLKLLEVMGISYSILDACVTEEELRRTMAAFKSELDKGRQVAFAIKKGALSYDNKVKYLNGNTLIREDAIERVAGAADKDIIVSSTGKISRELFDIRERNGRNHGHDFLTVGSMGHSSSIALGIALSATERKVWCIDGDGAVLMHMGAMAVIGAEAPMNLIHIVINNEAHETVGGMPTAAKSTDLVKIAESCGYVSAARADDMESLEKVLKEASVSNGPYFIEVRCAIGSRADLGRPTVSPIDNKKAFMDGLKI